MEQFRSGARRAAAATAKTLSLYPASQIHENVPPQRREARPETHMLSDSDIKQLNADLADAHPRDIMARALALFPATALSFSGAEDVLLLHFASKLDPRPAVFSLDTGRLHGETYRFIERVRAHYAIEIDILFPDADRVRELVSRKGLFSFYEDGHEECCAIRKVQPLLGKLNTVDAWITGQRRDQSPTRNEVALFERDLLASTEDHPVIKINPLANWSSARVWESIRALEVPYNPLHDQGFISIGCEPCTRPVGPNQHEREGRWWWEEATIKECGLHRPRSAPIATDAGSPPPMPGSEGRE